MINDHEYERALIFFNRKIPVHVSKDNGIFHNGLIIEISKEHFVLKDQVDGKEYFILFSELKKSLERYEKDERRFDKNE